MVTERQVLDLWLARQEALATGPYANPDGPAITDEECPCPTAAETAAWLAGQPDWFIVENGPR